ncbi:phosphatase PAP2 family protein [Kribbella jiaozuonensis]|uniref:Phosphatase PAP2 family protein n=1 Tax=Kribbella jiaozuonensis TaxID=2575441 RepID=A0A4U3LGF3_9ACTN|nr:phosphatase PAP2 family protein [Kribbella jiaozuonensis]TKK74520.1 phosphatase PAP2 family protein [Kribbella jiaozuonensis]
MTTRRAGAAAVVRTRGWRLFRGVLAMLVFALPVVFLGLAVRQQFEPLIRADNALSRAATGFSLRHGLVPALTVLQAVSQPFVVYIVATGVAVWVWTSKKLKGRALWAFVTMMVGWGIGGISKPIAQRARPVVDGQVPHAHGYSFPSGHTLNITLAAAVMVFLLWPLLSTTWRRVAVVLAIVVPVIVGLDRLFIGAHFPSDILAGHILGLGIMFASWIGFIGKTASTSSPGPSHPA